MGIAITRTEIGKKNDQLGTKTMEECVMFFPQEHIPWNKSTFADDMLSNTQLWLS